MFPRDRLEHPEDVAPLDFLHRYELGRVVACDEDVRRTVVADPLGKIVHDDLVEARERDRALDAILQLAHVAGPGVGDELRGGRGGDAATALRRSLRERLEEVLREREDVAARASAAAGARSG